MRLTVHVRSHGRRLVLAGAAITVAGICGTVLVLRHADQSRLRRAELADVALARGMLLEGDVAEVQRRLTRAGRPRTAEGACMLAISCANPAEALPWVRKALELDPESREAVRLLEVLYQGLLSKELPYEERRTRLLGEIEDYGRVRPIHPEYAEVLLQRATARIELYRLQASSSQLDAAKGELAAALEEVDADKDPKAAAAIHYQLGRAEALWLPEDSPERRGKAAKELLAASNDHFRAAARLNPELVDAWAELVRNVRQTDEIPAIIAELYAAAGAATTRGSLVRLWALVSSLQAGIGNLEKAELALRQCIAADPGSPGPYLTLANLKVAQAKPEEAEEILERLLEHDPNLVEAHIQLARLYVDTSRAGRGIRLLEQALALPPAPSLIPGDTNGARARAIAGGYLARVYLEKANDLRRALEVANKATVLAPPDAMLIDTVAWIRFRMGDKQRARLILERLLGGGPQLAVARYHLAAVLESLGEREAALRNLDEALALPGEFAERAEAERLRARLAVRGSNRSTALGGSLPDGRLPAPVRAR